MEAKFTRGLYETMGNMPESVCKKNDDGSIRWGCRVIPAVLDGSAEDDDIRRRECAAVATLFRASPLLYDVATALDKWSRTANPIRLVQELDPIIEQCRTALRAARGEK